MRLNKWLINILTFGLTIALAIVLGSQAPRLIKQWRGPFRHGDFSVHSVNQPYKLTLYGTSSCPYCAAAREPLIND